MRIEYHPELERELLEIRDHYHACSYGLGLEFVDAFEKQVRLIATCPERWMIISGTLRRSLMKGFPYVVYFRALGSEAIRVTVVKHKKRHPLYGLVRE